LSSLPLNDFLEGESVNKEELIINTLSETVKNWYYQQRSNNFKDIVINVSLRDSFSHFVNNSRAEVVFFVHSTMIPKVTKEEVENAPFLRGMQQYITENKKTLSDDMIKIIESKIREWKNELMQPIGKQTEENIDLKIVCELTAAGNIKKDTVQIFYDISGHGEPIWKDANNLFPSIPLTYEDELRDGYEEAKNLIEKFYKTYSESKEISPTAYYEDWYNRDNAKIYADVHTSNYSNTIKCWTKDQYGNWIRETSNGTMKDPNTGVDIWNMSEYPISTVTREGETRWEQLGCNNCADFVSQSMYYGGMFPDPSTDPYWRPSTRKTGYKGKWCWTYVPHLLDHMKNDRGDWEYSDYNNTQIGDVIIWPNETHIAMIDYNLYQNGTYTKKFAAHTNDRKQCLYSASNEYAHYKVSCWRWTP